MKMTEKDFNTLKNLINKTLNDHPHAINIYKNHSMSYTRFIWDAFCATFSKGSHSEFKKHLLSYLNDNHIETALKKIIPIENW